MSEDSVSRGPVRENEPLICRRCKVSAQVTVVNGEIARIACPTCKVSLKDEAARKVYIDQSRYQMRKVAADLLSRQSSKLGASGVTTRHTVNKPRDPGGPFVIGAPKS